MGSVSRPAGPDASELSCYTANLAAYLAGVLPDPTAHVAASIRLAVRTGTPAPAFSHHRYPLNALPDGTYLRYVGAETFATAAAGLDGELDQYGRVLAVADTFGLSWSPGYRLDSAPHWILIDGRRRGRWHVTDRFAALLPRSEQRPHRGWVDDAELAAALSARTPLADRDRYAFGVPVELPAAGPFRWLCRTANRPAGSAFPVIERWVAGTVAIEFLTEWFVARGVHAGAMLDDVWAASRHHEYRYRWLVDMGAIEEPEARRAAEAWRSLPQSLVFAVGSARRGRNRESVIRAGFAQVLQWTAEPLSSLGTSV